MVSVFNLNTANIAMNYYDNIPFYSNNTRVGFVTDIVNLNNEWRQENAPVTLDSAANYLNFIPFATYSQIRIDLKNVYLDDSNPDVTDDLGIVFSLNLDYINDLVNLDSYTGDYTILQHWVGTSIEGNRVNPTPMGVIKMPLRRKANITSFASIVIDRGSTTVGPSWTYETFGEDNPRQIYYFGKGFLNPAAANATVLAPAVSIAIMPYGNGDWPPTSGTLFAPGLSYHVWKR